MAKKRYVLLRPRVTHGSLGITIIVPDDSDAVTDTNWIRTHSLHFPGRRSGKGYKETHKNSLDEDIKRARRLNAQKLKTILPKGSFKSDAF